MNKQVIVWVCMLRGKGRCWEKGAEHVLKRFRAEVESKELNNVLVTPTGCSDRHDYGPAVALDPDDTWYCNVTPEDVTDIIHEHILNGKPVRRLMCAIQ